MNVNLGMNPNKIALGNGKMLKQELFVQSAYLKELIDRNIRDYRKAFKPQQYGRKGDLEKSVSVSEIKMVNGAYTVYVYFNENALHRSGYGVWAATKGGSKYGNDVQSFDSENSVNVAMLINDGYVVTKPVWFAELPNLGFRDGNKFIDRAVEEFNATNSLGIKIGQPYIMYTRKW